MPAGEREHEPKHVMMMSKKKGPPFVLFVCSANLCRSPLAANLLRARAEELELTLDVASAGTRIVDDLTMPWEIEELVAQLGSPEPLAHSRALTSVAADQADLILTASRSHSNEVIRLRPGLSRKTFTLRQFQRLLEEFPVTRDHDQDQEQEQGQTVDPKERFANWISDLADLRGHGELPADPSDDDTVDPFGGSLEIYAEVGAIIDSATRVIAAEMGRALDGH